MFDLAHRVIYIDHEKCDGCTDYAYVYCERACSRHVSHNGLSVIYVENVEGPHPLAMTCMQCVDASCARVCPTEAIRVYDGCLIMTPDQTKCVGCRNCVLACPFGVMKFDLSRELAVKCDMCATRISEGKPPLCVEACPRKAVSFCSLAEVASDVRRRVAGVLLDRRARQ